MTHPKIAFVDENDRVIGAGTILEQLQKGFFCRIIRIFLINDKREVLMQKRSAIIPSHPNKWDQSVGGHVDEGEEYETAAYRELKEELGVEGAKLQKIAYARAEEQNLGYTKKYFHTIYIGRYDGEVTIDPKEVAEVRWVSLDIAATWINERPQDFTPVIPSLFAKYRSAIEAVQ